MYRWKDGRVYEGQFEKGKQHGVGKYTARGVTRTGRWNQGVRVAWLDESAVPAAADN